MTHLVEFNLKENMISMQASLNLTPLQPKAKIFKLENVQDKEFKDCNQQDIYMDTSSGLG